MIGEKKISSAGDEKSHLSARKSWLFPILFFFLAMQPALYGAILLQTPDTEVSLHINQTTGQNQRLTIPICEMSLSAKHKGEGVLRFANSPLTNEKELVPYALVGQDGDFIEEWVYHTSSTTLKTIHMGSVWAKLSRPLAGPSSEYSSDIFVTLVLDM